MPIEVSDSLRDTYYRIIPHQSLRRCRALRAAAICLLLTITFFDTFNFSARAQGKSPAIDRLVIGRATHFVAVNGSDNGPGTAANPWATINYAAERAEAGDTIVVRGGVYTLSAQIRPRSSGRADAWVTFIGSPGETPVIDARMIPRSALLEAGLDNGAFQIEGVSYVRVVNLTVINSHDAGFTIRDASHIDLINNSTNGTFSSGIAVWDTKNQNQTTHYIRIVGNTIKNATSRPLDSAETSPDGPGGPHEAISIGGTVNFEVAYNLVDGSGKEGIDIKETSKHGSVHHNAVLHATSQCMYVDAWYGEIDDIEINANTFHDCKGAGVVLSVENGRSVDDISIHNNLIFNNSGSGLYFSRWGANNERRNIRIDNNTVVHNGYGTPKAGQTYYWMTGGLYLYSTNVRNVAIRNNIFSDNRGFQIGYSDLFLKHAPSWQAAARERTIEIDSNLIDGPNPVGTPIKSGGNPQDQVDIYAINGAQARFGHAMFKDPNNDDFGLRRGSPAIADHFSAGAYPRGAPSQAWWKQDFPPLLVHAQSD